MFVHHDSLQAPFITLLRKKLNRARICFGSDVGPEVVTLNSRVVYSVDGKQVGPHLIVQSEGEDFPDYALSIYTLQGLALLGLTEGQSITIEQADGSTSTLTVVQVVFQPEADRKNNEQRQAAVPASSHVIPFRRAPQHVNDFDPDDPGPRAA
jgi:regulator of nucleoside diphosphate kinase